MRYRNKILEIVISIILSGLINIFVILPFWSSLGYNKNILVYISFISLLSEVFYTTFRIIFYKEKLKEHIFNFILVYCLFLLTITFFKTTLTKHMYILNPIQSFIIEKNTMHEYIYAYINVIGNTLMYIPIGIYIKSINDKKLFDLTLKFLIFIVMIEFIQTLTLTGVFDTNDIVTNTLGFYLGVSINYLLKKKNIAINGELDFKI